MAFPCNNVVDSSFAVAFCDVIMYYVQVNETIYPHNIDVSVGPFEHDCDDVKTAAGLIPFPFIIMQACRGAILHDFTTRAILCAVYAMALWPVSVCPSQVGVLLKRQNVG